MGGVAPSRRWQGKAVIITGATLAVDGGMSI
jgi:hypothetical protein